MIGDGRGRVFDRWGRRRRRFDLLESGTSGESLEVGCPRRSPRRLMLRAIVRKPRMVTRTRVLPTGSVRGAGGGLRANAINLDDRPRLVRADDERAGLRLDARVGSDRLLRDDVHQRDERLVPLARHVESVAARRELQIARSVYTAPVTPRLSTWTVAPWRPPRPATCTVPEDAHELQGHVRRPTGPELPSLFAIRRPRSPEPPR